MTVPVDGYCAAGFERVRAAFEANFVDHGELGAAATMVVGGETVVDLWGGHSDLARTAPWRSDTLVNAYSVGKAVVSVLLLALVDRGAVELDAPVARYWPDFAQHGKERATVRHGLSHQAGVPAIREPLTNDDLWDFDRMTAALAATRPWFVPGERHVYHTNTFGHLIGGLIRHVTGELPGTGLRAVADPIGADLWFGVPDAEHPRCAEVHFDLVSSPAADAMSTGADEERQMLALGYANPPGYSSMGVVNTPEWRRAQVPSTNGHMSARGVARFYAELLAGRLISDDLLAEAITPQVSGPCPVLGQDVTFGLGLQPWTEHRPFGRNPGGFGHYGSGGALGFADPTAEVAFGYVMNHVVPRWQSPRNRALVDALYACL
ncbi:MAG: serine hydrolase domain-containing protein [Acidimicrobiales bacterium]|nr:serine hydrolase domain-containing protein [Acidimicrobiales bacterium]